MTDKPLSAARVDALFTTTDGAYRFSRWGRPIAPVIFGTDDETLDHLKDAMAATIAIAGMEFIDTDPELGSNLMIFICQEWDELDMVPNLDQMIPDLDILKGSLKRSKANQYRNFSFDDNGAIRSCIVLLRYDEVMSRTPIQTLGVGQMVQCMLVWGDEAFEDDSPIAVLSKSGVCVVKPSYAAVIHAAYDPVMPPSATDNAHALRVAARAEKLLRDLAEINAA